MCGCNQTMDTITAFVHKADLLESSKQVSWWLLHQVFLQNPPLHLGFETLGKRKSILPWKPITSNFMGYFTHISRGQNLHCSWFWGPRVVCWKWIQKVKLPCSESRWLATPKGGDLEGHDQSIHRSCAIDPFQVVYDYDIFVSDGMVRSVVICGGTATWSEEDMSCLRSGGYFNYFTRMWYYVLLCSNWTCLDYWLCISSQWVCNFHDINIVAYIN